MEYSAVVEFEKKIIRGINIEKAIEEDTLNPFKGDKEKMLEVGKSVIEKFTDRPGWRDDPATFPRRVKFRLKVAFVESFNKTESREEYTEYLRKKGIEIDSKSLVEELIDKNRLTDEAREEYNKILAWVLQRFAMDMARLVAVRNENNHKIKSVIDLVSPVCSALNLIYKYFYPDIKFSALRTKRQDGGQHIQEKENILKAALYELCNLIEPGKYKDATEDYNHNFDKIPVFEGVSVSGDTPVTNSLDGEDWLQVSTPQSQTVSPPDMKAVSVYACITIDTPPIHSTVYYRIDESDPESEKQLMAVAVYQDIIAKIQPYKSENPKKINNWEFHDWVEFFLKIDDKNLVPYLQTLKGIINVDNSFRTHTEINLGQKPLERASYFANSDRHLSTKRQV